MKDLGLLYSKMKETNNNNTGENMGDKRSKETLSKISEIEEYYQTLAAEVDERAVTLSSQEYAPSDPKKSGNDKPPSARDYNASVYEVRDAWQWTIEAAKCMQIHLRNAAQYHQFFSEVKHYDFCMGQLLTRLHHHEQSSTGSSPMSRTERNTPNATRLTREIKDILQQMLDIEAKVIGIFSQSGDILPVHLRKAPLATPIKTLALVTCTNKEIAVTEGEELTLLENSEVTKWKVRNSKGQEGFLPAIVCLIPPPDRAAILAALRLRQELMTTWKESLHVAKQQARKLMLKHLNEKEAKELHCLNPSQRGDVAKCIQDMMSFLAPSEFNHPESTEFREIASEWTDKLDSLQGTAIDRTGKSSSLQTQWSTHKKLLRQLQEYAAFAAAFEESVAGKRETQNFLVRDDYGNAKFVSKAYIERMRPVEIEAEVPEEDSEEDWEMRHMTLAEKVPSIPETTESELEVDSLNTSILTDISEEEMSQTIKETQTFVIKGVIDPRDHEEISIYQAIADGIISQTKGLYINPQTGDCMPIPEAMNRGLILVEFTNKSVETGDLIKSGIIRTTTTTDTVSYTILSVVDPVTGQRITVSEAIAKGIIDQDTGRYCNPLTGSSMSITSAIDRGLVDVEEIKENGHEVDMPDLAVIGVMDPDTGRMISLEEALQRGVIDPEKGLFRTASGELIPLADAIKKGYLKVKLASGEEGESNLLPVRTLKVLANDLESLQDYILPESMDMLDSKPIDINQTVFQKLKQDLNTKLQGVHDPLTGQNLTIEEAHENGILHLDSLHLENANGDKFTLQEAAVMGLIDPHVVRALLSAIEPHSLEKMIDSGLINPESGLYTDPITGETISIAEAIARGKLDPDQIFFKDLTSGTLTSLSSAIENNKFNPQTGKIVDPVTGREMSLAEAMKNHVIDPMIDADKLASQISALKFLSAFMDTKQKAVKNGLTGEMDTLEEAILNGSLDLLHGEYVNISTQERLPIAQAVENKLMDAKVAKNILAAMEHMSLGEALAKANIDPNTGKYIHPDTKKKMSIKDAIENGYLDPTTLFFVDPSTNNVTSLDAFIKEGKFNPATGKFKDPLTNLDVSINHAIKNGIVNPHIVPDELIQEKCKVKDLLSSSKINPQEATFQCPDGSTMSVKQALADGFLTPDSLVKLDPHTGHVVVAGDEELVKALINTKKNCDWLAGVESMLANQEAPVERAEDLDKQIAVYENMQKTMDQRQPSVSALLEKAKGLLDNNKDANGDAATQQQCQRLRFQSTDLKVRMDAVNTQLDRRLGHLHNMHHDLDKLYEELEEFEGWMDTADEEMKMFRTSMVDDDRSEVIKRSFEDFNEGVLAKEDDLKALNKIGRKVQDIVQECNKETKEFRHTLPNKPEFQATASEGLTEPVALVEKELDATNERYKRVVADCSVLMGKLSETAAKNKRYNGLKSQLEDTLPLLKQRVDECSDELIPGYEPQAQLDQLKAVTTEVISQGKAMEDLRMVGGELVEILEELDCRDTPKALEIQNAIETLQGQFDEIQDEVVDKQHRLNAAVAQSQDVSHNLTALLDWTEHTENTFNDMKPVSLDRDVLSDQIQTHRIISSDIENHRHQVDAVVEQCNEHGQNDRVNELLDRFDTLITRGEDRGSELEDVVQKLGTLHSNVHQLESWLAGAVHSLKRESSDFDHNSLKAKIENLYKQKQGKQQDLDQIKNIGKDLIDAPNTGDKHRLRETLADVQGKWHDLTELLVQMISFAALREIDDLLKYLDKAENEINTAEPISTDPETLAVQLRDHKAFHDDLEAKRKAVNDTIDKCNKMLRETTNEEAEDIKNKLDTIRNQADLVCKLSSERLAVLEEALPLASHFRFLTKQSAQHFVDQLRQLLNSETHADLQSWLGEIEAEIDSLDVPAESNVEQVKKQQDNAKTTQRIIEDHKPLVEDLVNTGHELMDLCTEEDASDLKEDIDNVTSKLEEVKASIREKLNQLDDAFRSVTTDVGDTVDGLLEELHYLHDQIHHADPIAANPDALKGQISENNAVLDDLERRQVALQNARDEVAKALELESPETAEDCEELRTKLHDLETLQLRIRDAAQNRGICLQEALDVAEKFRRDFQEAIQSLRDIQDNLVSQDSPGVDPSTVKEQQKELKAIEEELLRAQQPVSECHRTAEKLSTLCGVPGNMEIQKYIEDVNNLLEEIQDGVSDRAEELQSALDKAERYDSVLQAINSWLPKAETKLENMSPVAADPRSVRIQIEELKVFKIQTQPRYVDIQNLNQYASELKNASPITAESLSPQVKDINERWGKLLKGTADREAQLKDTLLELGELDHTIDEVLGLIQQTEADLQQMDYVFGDPKYIETNLKRIQMIQKDLGNQEPVIRKLNKAIDKLVERTGQQASPLAEKREEMIEQYRAVQVMARDKQNELQDTLKEVKAFMGEVEDDLRWLNEFRAQLKSSSPMGALPDTAQKQFDTFMNQYRELERTEEAIKALLLNGEDMLARCREEDGRQLRENLARLQTRAYDTRNKAEKRRRKLEQHLQNVQDFHAMLKIHTDWLSNAEKILASFKYPSKLVDKVTQQIQEHKDFKSDIEAHREIMQNLDRTGTYLKYFGRKQDTVYIKNLLISIKLRWKKLVRRTDEKGRLLQQAYKEDKRFYDAWKGLFDWLDTSEKKMKKYAMGTPAKVKQDINELRNFQHQLSAKHPIYYSTMRLGRSLKDRCVKTDPERDVLNSMLEDLKNKWSVIRSIVSQRQNKLDEALLSSGRVSDALASLMEWLGKAEAYLAEDQPILGDLDTVNLLIEQHKAFQQELESRQGMVQLMRASTGDAAVNAQLDELASVWERVNKLSDVREAKLQEALKLAEEFNEAVQVVREWLPHAEAELKFRALPEDEDAIVALMEHHEKFQEELQGQQANIERIRFMAEEILQSCHPNAVRFVKYYLTITQTRWEQAINRSNQRSVRLQEALRSIRGNAALLEDLITWLTEAQALLTTKEKDLIPEDLTVVEALVKEHLEFHDDLSNKNKDAERLTKLVMPNNKKHLHGSAWKLNEVEAPSARLTTLQNKWRNVWRISVDRKKKLQDALDHLLELESFKNFDFDLWRQRYISWIRAKKFRITDFFRRQDKDGDGTLSRNEFVDGMLASKFPTNRTEMNAVFDIFDTHNTGSLDYQEFVNALRPDRQRIPRTRAGKKPITDSELITDEIEQQISHCQCRHQFKAQKVGEGKFKFGDKGKLCLVRFLNSTVMVRVGGGWVTLSEFLEGNDPCRAKGRMNTEFRESFILPEGASQSRAGFSSRRRASTPNAGVMNSKLSGSVSSLNSLGKSNNAGLSSKSKNSLMARSCSNLSQSSASSRGLSIPPRKDSHASAKSSGSPSPLAQSTPRRGTIHTPTTAPRSRQSTPKSRESPATNGRATPVEKSTNGRTTPSGGRTPTSQRSRSPASRGLNASPTPRKLSSIKQTMRF